MIFLKNNMVLIIAFCFIIILIFKNKSLEERINNDVLLNEIIKKNRGLTNLKTMISSKNYNNSINLVFKGSDCQKCVDTELKRLKKNKKKNVNIHIVGSEELFKTYLRLYKDYFNVVKYRDLLGHNVEKITPLLFVVDSNGYVLKSQFSVVGIPQYTEKIHEYFKNYIQFEG